MKQKTNGCPFVWAHRGASGYRDDNTYASFDLAVRLGSDGIETDVRMTLDGVMVLCHDRHLKYNGASVPVDRLTLDQVRTVRVGDDESIPTLEDALIRYRDAMAPSGAPLQWSLDVLPPRVGVSVADLVRRLGMSSRVVITPGDADGGFWQALHEIRSTNPDARMVRTVNGSWGAWWARPAALSGAVLRWGTLRSLGIEGVNIWIKYLSPRRIAAVRARNMALYVWDCHDESAMKQAIACGADAVYTNYPDRFRTVAQGSA